MAKRPKLADFVREETKTINVSITISEYALLEQLAHITHRPINDVLSQVISDLMIPRVKRMLTDKPSAPLETAPSDAHPQVSPIVPATSLAPGPTTQPQFVSLSGPGPTPAPGTRFGSAPSQMPVQQPRPPQPTNPTPMQQPRPPQSINQPPTQPPARTIQPPPPQNPRPENG